MKHAARFHDEHGRAMLRLGENARDSIGHTAFHRDRGGLSPDGLL
jgi:hypothetical protein